MKSALELAQEIASHPDVVRVLEALEGDRLYRGDVAYMPGLSSGMIRAGRLFDHIVSMLRGRQVKKIAVSGSDGRGWDDARDFPTAAWPGVFWYLDELMARDIFREEIVPITMGPQRQSLQETEALLRQANKEGWKTIVMVTVDYHRPRQVLGMVKQMKMLGQRRLYFPSIPFDWSTEMLGSQNARTSTGAEEAFTDWNIKIPMYQEKGDLASITEFNEYIKWRNTR